DRAGRPAPHRRGAARDHRDVKGQRPVGAGADAMSMDAYRDDEVSTARYRSAGTTSTPHYHAGVAVVCTCSTPDDLEGGKDAVEPEVEEIRSEIEHTRAEMSHTIDAIQDRLNPRRLVQEAQETVREATVGKAERMMNEASDAATGMVSSAGDT